MFESTNHNVANPSGVYMGLSTISILQQGVFLNTNAKSYFMRRVGQSVQFFKSSVKEPKRRVVTERQLAALNSQRFTGFLSKDVQKKMIGTVQNWSDTIDEMNARNLRNQIKTQYQINMLTITLSATQQHNDKFIKRWLLVPFIAKLVKTNPDVSYLWRAEPQKNGNIHFHILIDRYFSKDWVQREWNKTQSQHGYHSQLTESKTDLGKNSTRIEALASKDNAISYVAKYISKNEGDRAIEGRLWGCSDRLRKLQPIEYNLNKQQVIDVIKEISNNPVNMWESEYGVRITYPHNWPLIQNSLRLNFSADLALAKNVDIMFTRSLNPIFEMRATTWFKAVCEDIGDFNAAYLEAQNLLFTDSMLAR